MFRQTGDISIGRGYYHSDCRCRVEVAVRRGDHFPICPRCRKSVGWSFTRPFSATSPANPTDLKEPPRVQS